MTTPVEQLSFIPTNATTKRSLADWTGDVINVKNFGAVGDGATDDYAAIQAAFNAAFGTEASPHGNVNPAPNIPVFFPKGRYRTLTPLRITNVWGGHIFGAGTNVSGIKYEGGLAPVGTTTMTAKIDNGAGGAGNILDVTVHSGGHLATGMTIRGAGVTAGTQITGYGTGNGTTGTYTVNNVQNVASEAMTADEDWTPVIWLNGANFLTIQDIGFEGSADTSTHRTVSMWWGPDGGNGGSSAHGNLLLNSGTYGTSYGVIHGSANSAANSENTYINCGFVNHETVGFFCSGANTLNMRLIGGTISQCTTGIKTNNSATIPIIQAVASDHCTPDIDLAASGFCTITGMRTESTYFVKTNAPTNIVNCRQASGSSAATGSTSGTTLTITAGSVYAGMVITGTDGVNSLPSLTRVIKDLGGGTWQLSAAGAPGDIAAGTAFAMRSIFCEMIGSTQTIMDLCGSDYNPLLISAGNSMLHLRSNGFVDQSTGEIAADLLTYFTGQFFEYDITGRNLYTVAKLPTATSSFKGIRMFVLDASVTAVSSNFGTNVAGGGANAVPVFCDGTNWKIG